VSRTVSVLHLGSVDYGTALRLQQTLVDLRRQNRVSDVLLLLEHPPVITLGRNASQKNLLASGDVLREKRVELFESNRGGDITFHGPGQLVGYPIFDLRGFTPRIGAVEFVRRVEEALIRTCGDLGIPCERICGLTGVWTQPANPKPESTEPTDARECKSPQAADSGAKKIAAIGVHISGGISSHGFALNVTTDLDYFKLIVPCGISDRPVTSVAQELEGARPVPSMEQIAHSASLNFGRLFSTQMLWLESLDALLAASAGPEGESLDGEESNTIGVPLRVPSEFQDLRREQRAPRIGGEDEVSLA
jgi:lipoyl(octanoyl) transferase